MARDGSGTYNRTHADYVAGNTIESSAVNGELNDMAAALTGSLAKNGETVPTGNLPMGTYKHTNVGAASARTDYARASQIADNSMIYAADTGTADAIAIAPAPGISAYAVGQTFDIKKISSANATATPTAAVNGLAAGTITWPDGSALRAGDIPGSALFTLKVSATTPVFHLMSPSVPNRSYVAPQGRLTLSTGVAVMIAAQTAKTVAYYTPYVGNLVPIYDGTQMVPTTFAELSNDSTASATGKAGPAAVTTNSNYDYFVWNDGGTVRLTRGGAWNSATARSAATENDLQQIQGVWTNKNAITNGPAANKGTYVGTLRSDGSSQLNWQPGAAAASGTAALMCVWNAYNRVDVRGLIGDSTDSWNYTTATVRSANASDTMRVSFVVGLQEDYFEAEYRSLATNSGGAVTVAAGIGYDATNAFSGRIGNASASAAFGVVEGDHAVQALGFHYMQACEYSVASGTTTWYGDEGTPATFQSGLRYRGRF